MFVVKTAYYFKASYEIILSLIWIEDICEYLDWQAYPSGVHEFTPDILQGLVFRVLYFFFFYIIVCPFPFLFGPYIVWSSSIYGFLSPFGISKLVSTFLYVKSSLFLLVNNITNISTEGDNGSHVAANHLFYSSNW